jgi:hypothetical protein
MSDINKFSEGLIDVAERFADVVDAAQGKGARKDVHVVRWLALPAAGAAAYALAVGGSGVARQTRDLMRRAKDRATDLPDADLVEKVREVTGTANQRSTNGQSRSRSTGRSQAARRRSGQTRRRRTAATGR